MKNTSLPKLFNPKRQKAIEARAKRIAQHDADFLVREAATMISERLGATNREFELVVDLFSPFGVMKDLLQTSKKTGNVISVTSQPSTQSQGESNILIGEREVLPLASKSTNLVTSIFGLHWSNDLPGTLLQIRNSLKEDGLFLAALPGDRTLNELRDCLLAAESKINGNATLRIDPFGEVRQIGSLLQRAGFTLPVVDTELLTVRYSSMQGLIRDLRAMGATSALYSNVKFGPKSLFVECEKLYKERYQDPDGKLRATFEIIFVSGWSPHASQQKALKPGTAKNKLSDFLGN